MTIDRRKLGVHALWTAGLLSAQAFCPSEARDKPNRAPKSGDAMKTRIPTVIAFDTVGHIDPSGDFWHVPIEIWAYRPQDSAVRKGILAGLFRSQYGLSPTPANQALFDRRINLMLADNVSRFNPSVRIGSEVPDFPPTGANGHTQLTVRVPVYPATPVAKGARLPIDVTNGSGSVAHLLPENGLSIISDIDDTVKDSGVLDKQRLWDKTFFQPFSAVSGMAALVTRLSGADGAVHYVSSTPWHLYAPLREWLHEADFPVSSVHLKQIRLKDSTVFDIFKSPETVKAPVIAGLVRRWPKRRFVLIGDSGEKDPEIYGAIARQFQNQIVRIFIRRAPGDTSTTARFEAAFAGVARDSWQVFDAPSDITWTP
jgi:Uncharacterized conserved protein (DUF2183)